MTYKRFIEFLRSETIKKPQVSIETGKYTLGEFEEIRERHNELDSPHRLVPIPGGGII